MIFFVLNLFLSSINCGCVTDNNVKLHYRPTEKSTVTWVVHKYMPLKKIGGYKKDWIKVQDVDGVKHWINSKNYTDNYSCLLVKKNNVPIKAFPGNKSPLKYKEKTQKYDSFKLLEKKKYANNEWIKAEDSFGDTGWIDNSELWVQ